MEVTEKDIELKTKDGEMPAVVYTPTGGGKHPAIIVIQEAFGVNGYVKSTAKRFAEQGYITIAPEMFYRSGKHLDVPYNEFPKAREYIMKLTDDGIISDLTAILEQLKSMPNLLEDRVGIVGYCMGGRVAFLAACMLSSIKAAAVYYGGGIMPMQQQPGGPAPRPGTIEKLAGINCPIISFWGGKDQGIPFTAVDEFEHRMHAAGKSVQVNKYPEAEHGFFTYDRQSYNKAAADDAWPKTVSFFNQHLQHASVGSR
ncbi:MAG: dienelactone hydrolase family protein [Dehalococcoidia bacterium]|nr:dienelactone hydrolase family protein [Dehalococcoidia bacterium]